MLGRDNRISEISQIKRNIRHVRFTEIASNSTDSIRQKLTVIEVAAELSSITVPSWRSYGYATEELLDGY